MIAVTVNGMRREIDNSGKARGMGSVRVQDMKVVSKYTGKVDGDTIKGKVETKRGDQEGRSRDWEAKRAKA